MASKATSGPGQGQEPGTPTWFCTCVAWDQVHGPSSTAVPESGTPIWDASHKHQQNLLCHSASPCISPHKAFFTGLPEERTGRPFSHLPDCSGFICYWIFSMCQNSFFFFVKIYLLTERQRERRNLPPMCLGLPTGSQQLWVGKPRPENSIQSFRFPKGWQSIKSPPTLLPGTSVGSWMQNAD